MNSDNNSYGDMDLNLMRTFLVLFREGNVSRTARCLGVSQPAISNALARLRQHFADPLFLRTGRGMRPTPKATNIANALLPAMACIESIIRGAC
jgi:DNA-binding transcriptional LysR family regulator